MFGLFDRPCLKIAKHSPDWARNAIEECERLIQARTVCLDLSDTEIELVKGVALSAWILNEHRQGRVTLSDYQGRYISNMGTNCASILRDKSGLAVDLVHQLEADGVIEKG